MTIFPNYAQLPPYRPSGADDSEVILHSAGLDFTGLADIQYRNVVLLFFQQVREFLHRDLGNVIQLIAAGNPTANAVLEVRLYVFNANARQPHLRFPQMVSVFSDEDDALVETKNPGRPGRVLPGEANVD